MLTQTKLKALLRYDRHTGLFYWRVDRNNFAYAGERAGCLKPNGYWNIGIDRKVYRAHRLAWLYIYGRWPRGDLDHKNRDLADNRIANLREALESQNIANSRVRKDNGHRLKGVSKHWNKWRARVSYKGLRINLGVYNTPQAAHAAYCKAAKKLYGEFFHDGT